MLIESISHVHSSDYKNIILYFPSPLRLLLELGYIILSNIYLMSMNRSWCYSSNIRQQSYRVRFDEMWTTSIMINLFLDQNVIVEERIAIYIHEIDL
jgi:hypothetical protein